MLGVLTVASAGSAATKLRPSSRRRKPSKGFSLQAGAVALMINLMGFFGGLVMSAIKRDRGVKDWGIRYFWSV